MNDLIHKIVGTIIEVGQSDTKKFRLGETIRYSPSEILEILKQHENEIFGEESSTQTNAFNVLNALDCVSRVQALNNIKSLYPEAPRIKFMDNLVQWKKKYSQYMECERVIENLPPVHPDQKVGKWIDHSDDGYVECPFCGSATNCDDNINELHYCFSCGAKMERKQKHLGNKSDLVVLDEVKYE